MSVILSPVDKLSMQRVKDQVKHMNKLFLDMIPSFTAFPPAVFVKDFSCTFAW